ncbi:hypothetical protein [Haloarchaeobius litoreus]|uniref:Uncharacterized protein n=1 Tax=Haloarchaeobius litoreus TaxID=755306 RepID=A0ABD6DFC8_9EURY|nr:hypothetical protein [Haloarchaeobius litoreus]
MVDVGADAPDFTAPMANGDVEQVAVEPDHDTVREAAAATATAPIGAAAD